MPERLYLVSALYEIFVRGYTYILFVCVFIKIIISNSKGRVFAKRTGKKK